MSVPMVPLSVERKKLLPALSGKVIFLHFRVHMKWRVKAGSKQMFVCLGSWITLVELQPVPLAVPYPW